MRTSSDLDDDQAITERFLAIGAAVILVLAGLTVSLRNAESGGGDDTELDSEARGEPGDDPLGGGAEAQPDESAETPARTPTSSASIPASVEEVTSDCSQDTTGEGAQTPPDGVVVLYLSDNQLHKNCTFNAFVSAPGAFDSEPTGPPSRERQIERVDAAFETVKDEACSSTDNKCDVELLVVGRGARGSVLAAHWACEGAGAEATSMLFLSSPWAAWDLDCRSDDQSFEIRTIEIDPMRPTSPDRMIDSVDAAIAEL